jgi:hypothetical protein
MSKMIQVRNVPDRVHRQIKARAALAGMSLSDYLLAELRFLCDHPTEAELKARLPTFDDDLSPSPAEVIREERDHQ